jgi:hypothetical protein
MSGFTCEKHNLCSQTLPHCPRCWEIAHDSRTSWQPHTHTQSKQEASNSAGTSDFQDVPKSQQLFQILQQVTALQQSFAGISYDRHNPFQDFMNPPKDGIRDAIHSQTSASIAKLHQMVMDLYTRVLAAELGLLTNSGEGMRAIYWDPEHAPRGKQDRT